MVSYARDKNVMFGKEHEIKWKFTDQKSFRRQTLVNVNAHPVRGDRQHKSLLFVSVFVLFKKKMRLF